MVGVGIVVLDEVGSPQGDPRGVGDIPVGEGNPQEAHVGAHKEGRRKGVSLQAEIVKIQNVWKLMNTLKIFRKHSLDF